MTGGLTLIKIIRVRKSISRSNFFWEGNSSDHKKIITFSSDVICAETKIGEINLSISATEINKFEKRFRFGVLSNFTVLLFVMIMLYYSTF